jgi:hypothetical protein
MITLAGNTAGQNGSKDASGQGDQVVKSVLVDKIKNNYQITKRVISIKSAHACMNRPESTFTAGGYLMQDCGWDDVDKQIDLHFYAKEQNYPFYNQDYALITPLINGNGGGSYNLTSSTFYSPSPNRALGNIISMEPSTSQNQASNEIVSTLTSNTRLLGLQSVNSSSNRDSNTNRPQLQTFYRIQNDNIGGVISYKGDEKTPVDASTVRTTAGINSAITRTGQPSLRFGRPFKLKISR